MKKIVFAFVFFLFLGVPVYAKTYPYVPQMGVIVAGVQGATAHATCSTMLPLPPITTTVEATQVSPFSIFLPFVGGGQCMDYTGAYIVQDDQGGAILPLYVNGSFILQGGAAEMQLVPVPQATTDLTLTNDVALPQVLGGFTHVSIYALAHTHPAVQAAVMIPGPDMPANLEEIQMAERGRIVDSWLQDGNFPQAEIVLPGLTLLYPYMDIMLKSETLYSLCPEFLGQYPVYTATVKRAPRLLLGGSNLMDTWVLIAHDPLLIETCSSGTLQNYHWLNFRDFWKLLPESTRKLVDIELNLRLKRGGSWRQKITLAPNPVFSPLPAGSQTGWANINIFEADGNAVVYMIIEQVQAVMPDLYAIFMAP